MQDRYLVIAIIVIMAICCLGGYVAVSGFINNAASLSALTPGIAATPIIVAVSTDTPAPVKPAATAVSAATAAPVPSPLGAFETIAAASITQQPPTPAPTAGKASNPPTPSPVSAVQSCSGFTFCAKGGAPDFSLGPKGEECPSNYIWGRVVDKDGNGMPNMRIRFKLVSTGETNSVLTKAAPDPPGAYNIPAQPGGSWVIWLTDAGNPISPQSTVVPQSYGGSGNCPTRVDFVQQ